MARLLTYGVVLNERKGNSSVTSSACGTTRGTPPYVATLCFYRHRAGTM